MNWKLASTIVDQHHACRLYRAGWNHPTRHIWGYGRSIHGWIDLSGFDDDVDEEEMAWGIGRAELRPVDQEANDRFRIWAPTSDELIAHLPADTEGDVNALALVWVSLQEHTD